MKRFLVYAITGLFLVAKVCLQKVVILLTMTLSLTYIVM